MDDSGCNDETSFTRPNPSCHDGAINAQPSQGQGERQIYRESGQKGDLNLDLVETLIKQMCRLRLANDRNWCYANSAVVSLIWTLLCLHQRWWTTGANIVLLLISFLQQVADRSALLPETDWFQQALGTGVHHRDKWIVLNLYSASCSGCNRLHLTCGGKDVWLLIMACRYLIAAWLAHPSH